VRVYFEAYGCAQNLGEGRALERRVHDAGHSVVADPAAADVGVLVTCAVIGPTEARMVRRWRALVERVPRVVVTGCLVPLRSSLLEGPGRERTTLLPISEQSKLPALLDSVRAETLDPRPNPGDSAGPALPVVGRTPSPIEEISLAQGCTSHCSYCFSRLARGPLRSRSRSEILAQARDARARGAVEIRLTSLDTSCYGMDRPPGEGELPQLLEDLAAAPGEFGVRVGMMSPQTLTRIADPFLDAFARGPCFRFLHLPVQSGSNEVLREMRRGYTVGDFRKLVDRARARCPDLMLATDVIVGYPTETDEDFASTLGLVDEIHPEILNVTRFSARPFTPAARSVPLASRVIKRRSRAMTEHRLRVARRQLEPWIGRREAGWVTERGDAGTALVRLDSYRPVVVPYEGPLGVRVVLRVVGARSTYLLGHIEETAPN
jgi:threonylcarbamoyladenosine tRNA methylthiotransferase CDKAL1